MLRAIDGSSSPFGPGRHLREPTPNWTNQLTGRSLLPPCLRTYPHVCHRLRVNKNPVKSGTAIETHYCARPSGLIQANSEEELEVARAWGLRIPDGHPCATRVPPQCRPSATRLPPACHPGHVRTYPPIGGGLEKCRRSNDTQGEGANSTYVSLPDATAPGLSGDIDDQILNTRPHPTPAHTRPTAKHHFLHAASALQPLRLPAGLLLPNCKMPTMLATEWRSQ